LIDGEPNQLYVLKEVLGGTSLSIDYSSWNSFKSQHDKKLSRGINNTTLEDPSPNSQSVQVEIQAIYTSLEYARMNNMKTKIDEAVTNDGPPYFFYAMCVDLNIS